MGIAHDRGARAERAAARLLGGVRTGNRGAAAADVTVGDWAVVEVKSRATLPAWLKHAVHQAEVGGGSSGVATAADCPAPRGRRPGGG